MTKVWKLVDSKSNKLILIKEKCIYKGNPKENDFVRINSDTNTFPFLNDLFSIPYSYIRKIENQKGKKDIKILYGKDSEEELIVENESTKNEIFEFLKTDISNFEYSEEVPKILKYVKPQFFALLIVTGLFLWSMYLAVEIENGAEYIIKGRGVGIAGIALGIATFGTVKIVIGYFILLVIILFSLFKKLKTRTEIKTLKRIIKNS